MIQLGDQETSCADCDQNGRSSLGYWHGGGSDAASVRKSCSYASHRNSEKSVSFFQSSQAWRDCGETNSAFPVLTIVFIWFMPMPPGRNRYASAAG
jgi:hypothetical protein